MEALVSFVFGLGPVLDPAVVSHTPEHSATILVLVPIEWMTLLVISM